MRMRRLEVDSASMANSFDGRIRVGGWDRATVV